ncbi:prolyl-tRNA synthetase associated domain-containing protein [Phascolarctobacterium sp.]|uniref:prolyl-tRNA synthetase associated domain-containing protein n=1 Tax=Phascolarctobacterium sp. TaxID=2049039 RepID=UPI003F7DC0CC
MNKQEVYEFLQAQGVTYEVTEHKAVYNMDELAEVELLYPEADAKNLFVRDDKKSSYYLITVRGGKRVDLQEFRKSYGTRRLSFASAEDLERLLGLFPGSVTPLGLLNNTEKNVKLFLDSDFGEGDLIGVHPNENTATVWLKAGDLVRLIREHGNEVELIK